MKEKELENEIRLAKNAYHRKWQENNKEKVKRAQQKYWTKKASANRGQERST